MLARVRPWLVILGLGAVALLWGLGVLQSMLMAERDEAMAALGERESVLEDFARRTIELRLEEGLSATRAQIDAARSDPLLATSGLVLAEHGRRILPRPAPAATDSAPARGLYDAIVRGAPIDAAPQSPWAERLALLTAFRDALDDPASGRVEDAFRAIMRHRALHVIDSRLDLPARVAALDLLADKVRPHPSLMRDMLREGANKGGAQVIEGLQRALLRRRARFGRADFDFLASRIIDLCRRFGVEVDDFAARSSEEAAAPEFESVDTPTLLAEGTLYVRPEAPDLVVGVVADVESLVEGVRSEMYARGLLEEADTLTLAALPKGPLGLDALQFDVDAPRFVALRAEAQRRFWLKTVFVVLCGVLATTIVALAMVFQSRRHRFLELKSNFVAAVSHELRTPLASIRLMAETLERRTRGIPRVRDYPTRIVGEIDELAFLVENLLSFNRLDKGRWKPRRELFDAEDLVAGLRDDLENFGPERVELQTDGFDELTLWADPELLRLLLRNLAKNACAYNERDPVCLELSATETADGWRVDFSDNGVGIEPADRTRVFGDFYRARATRSRGSGLGLAICRQIMHAHQGSIEIASSGPAGTTFALTFGPSIIRNAEA